MENLQVFNGQTIETCNILGVNIAAINMEWLLGFTKRNINELSGHYMCVSNVHTTVMAYKNKDYLKIQNSAVLAIPDGGPLSSEGRRRGHKKMQRTTGPSYMEEVFKISAKNGYRHYFYGSTEETLSKLKDNLLKRYPGIQIVGMYSPPFGDVSNEERENIIGLINSSNAEFVWVGLGAPKQEMWMYQQRGIVKGFMVGVGAGFDYFAGNIKRAPKWMQKMNLEWLYRLFQSPRRLFRRYLLTNPCFIWNAIIRRK